MFFHFVCVERERKRKRKKEKERERKREKEKEREKGERPIKSVEDGDWDVEFVEQLLKGV